MPFKTGIVLVNNTIYGPFIRILRHLLLLFVVYFPLDNAPPCIYR